jgi:RNA polymerase sigma-70 factor (ECF subfamily)
MTDDSIPTRASLLNRLKNPDDQQGWQEFVETYRRLIHGVAIKAGLTDAEAQDVVQDTVISVSRNLAEFKYDPAVCSFRTWMLRLTRWRIIDQIRKRAPGGAAPAGASGGRGDDTATTATLERIPNLAESDLELLWNSEWETAVLDVAMARVKRRISPEQFQMFDLYALKQMPVRQVAEILGVSMPRVYLAKHRVAVLLKKEIKALEREMI